uniref:Oxidoreductase FAD/NAD(P)-binding domain-containing protein n=1 Tax=Anas platyrhynchos platyrhynchos TaxID=8840 RepID=A0A493TT20_ANAPP
MKFPADPDTPVIMIGPGTGVAPFRAAIQERVAQGWKGSCLFFGCRQKSKDFYCQAEWEELVTKGFLTLFTAFSRDQEEKVYVQHRIQENRRLVWELLTSRSAHVYLAGNFPVPCRVRPALLHSREKENFADYPGSVGQAAGHTITPVLALPHLPSCLPASQGFLGPSPQSGDSYPQTWGSGLVWLPHSVRLGKSRACVALTTAGFWRGHEDGCWCLASGFF